MAIDELGPENVARSVQSILIIRPCCPTSERCGSDRPLNTKRFVTALPVCVGLTSLTWVCRAVCSSSIWRPDHWATGSGALASDGLPTDHLVSATSEVLSERSQRLFLGVSQMA